MKTEDILKDAKEAFDLAREHEAENRREALDDIRFARLGEQWPDKVRKDRELDGRPCPFECDREFDRMREKSR